MQLLQSLFGTAKQDLPPPAQPVGRSPVLPADNHFVRGGRYAGKPDPKGARSSSALPRYPLTRADPPIHLHKVQRRGCGLPCTAIKPERAYSTGGARLPEPPHHGQRTTSSFSVSTSSHWDPRSGVPGDQKTSLAPCEPPSSIRSGHFVDKYTGVVHSGPYAFDQSYTDHTGLPQPAPSVTVSSPQGFRYHVQPPFQDHWGVLQYNNTHTSTPFPPVPLASSHGAPDGACYTKHPGGDISEKLHPPYAWTGYPPQRLSTDRFSTSASYTAYAPIDSKTASPSSEAVGRVPDTGTAQLKQTDSDTGSKTHLPDYWLEPRHSNANRPAFGPRYSSASPCSFSWHPLSSAAPYAISSNCASGNVPPPPHAFCSVGRPLISGSSPTTMQYANDGSLHRECTTHSEAVEGRPVLCGITGRDLTPTVDTAMLAVRDVGPLTVQYFDLRRFLGRGGKIRLFLRMKHLKHVYEALSTDHQCQLFVRERQNDLMKTGGSPTGHLPVLLHNTKTFCETNTILRYLAKLLGEYGKQADGEDYFADMMMDKLAYWTDDLMVAINEACVHTFMGGTILYLQRRSGYFSLFNTLLGRIRSAWVVDSHKVDGDLSSNLAKGSGSWVPTWYDAAVAATIFDDMQLVAMLRDSGEMSRILTAMMNESQAYQVPGGSGNYSDARNLLHADVVEKSLLSADGTDLSGRAYPMLFAYYNQVTSGPLVREMLFEKEMIRRVETRQLSCTSTPGGRVSSLWPVPTAGQEKPGSSSAVRCDKTSARSEEFFSDVHKPEGQQQTRLHERSPSVGITRPLSLSGGQRCTDNAARERHPQTHSSVQYRIKEERTACRDVQQQLPGGGVDGRFPLQRRQTTSMMLPLRTSTTAAFTATIANTSTVDGDILDTDRDKSPFTPSSSDATSKCTRPNANAHNAEAPRKYFESGSLGFDHCNRLPSSGGSSRITDAGFLSTQAECDQDTSTANIRNDPLPNSEKNSYDDVTSGSNAATNTAERKGIRTNTFRGARTELLLTTSGQDDTRSRTSLSSLNSHTSTDSLYPQSSNSRSSPSGARTRRERFSFSRSSELSTHSYQEPTPHTTQHAQTQQAMPYVRRLTVQTTNQEPSLELLTSGVRLSCPMKSDKAVMHSSPSSSLEFREDTRREPPLNKAAAYSLPYHPTVPKCAGSAD